jgi:TonB family protein
VTAYAEPSPLFASDGFRRLFGWSAVAHGIMVISFMLAPELYSLAPTPAPIFVEVIAAPQAPTPPSARPKQVVDEAVIIPKRPRAKPKPKPAPAIPTPPPPKAEPKKEPEPTVTAEQLLEQIRAKHTPAAAETKQGVEGTQTGRLDPELAAYRRQVENLIYTNWVGLQAYRYKPGVQVVFQLEIDATGSLRDVRLIQGSGDRHLDESAERAIHKSVPLPPPPRSVRTLRIYMDPREQT